MEGWDRAEMGRELAARLAALVSGRALVAALPRGGVEVAAPIAERLRAPLTLCYARPLVVPEMPDVVFGAVADDGGVLVNAFVTAGLRLATDEMEAARLVAATEMERARARYGAPLVSSFLPGRTVVFVVEALACVYPVQAAVASARTCGARDVLVAAACADVAAARALREQADAVLCAAEVQTEADPFWPDRFEPASDLDVLAALGRSAAVPPAGPLPALSIPPTT